jgi:hypothetical protein
MPVIKYIENKKKYFIMILLFPLTLLLGATCHSFPQQTEYLYSLHIYPILTQIISPITGFFPFAVVEICLYVLILLCLVFIIRGIINIKSFRLIMIVSFIIKIAGTLALMYFIFTIMWGLNYNRLPLEQSLSYKSGVVTKTELAAMLTSELSEINAICPKLQYDDKHHSYYAGGIFKMEAQTNDGFARIAQQNGLFNKVSVRPKAVIASYLMSYTGIEGISIPFTYEPCVNTTGPQFMWPTNMAHEAAHIKGFAREDEANFLSYLANSQNNDIYFRYSAHMFAYIYLSDALAQTDSELFTQIASKLDTSAAYDFDYYNQYVNRFAGPVQNISQDINNTYLKSQGQQGVISYGYVVQLLAAKYRTENNK